ncbi:hypothetical protein A11Q_1217 [Pseudobdellovibrio exovorus JSS]|uniref:Uncharacterized protein n=1 Tax=Pseudobdellovibrio exovorus JSS TaxID=1184267 RepID=M4V894_9BACT|nr:hypothetical protein A11Q_1217 [Pseudobdellovibrio exovorus JSS]
MLLKSLNSSGLQVAIKASLLLSVVFGTVATHAATCMRIMEDTYGQLVEDPKASHSPDKSKNLKQGQLYPSASSTDRFINVLIGRDTYRVPKSSARAIRLRSCILQPVCLVTNTDGIAVKSTEKSAEDPNNGNSFRAGRKFPAIAMKQVDGERFFLVGMDGDYYWLKGQYAAMNINKTCEEVAGVDAGAQTSGRGKYSFGFEVGMGSGYKSDAYGGFITPVPDPNNVGPLSNPVITEVKKGKGLIIGPLLDVHFSEDFKIKFGAQYQETKYEYVGKENPTIAANPLSSLPDISGTIKNQALVFSIAPAYELGNRSHRLGLGINVKTHYYISKPASIVYRVGTVFKGTEVTTEAGPKGFETLFLGQLYYQWYASSDSPFALRLTGETDGSVMTIGLSAFY